MVVATLRGLVVLKNVMAAAAYQTRFAVDRVFLVVLVGAELGFDRAAAAAADHIISETSSIFGVDLGVVGC